MTDATIYHNPNCSTSRQVLDAIRAAGIEPRVVQYLKTPPSRADLERLLARAGLSVRDILRRKAPEFAELGLDNPALGDSEIFAAIAKHPVLIERPIVETEKGVRLCRPKEKLAEIL
jgi:arsenate reductase (glutaredoxin)